MLVRSMEENPSQQTKILIPTEKLKIRLQELAKEINHDYQDCEIVAVCILKGSFVFFSDLIRLLDIPMTCEFLGITHYSDSKECSGEMKVTLDINEPLKNRHVIVFKDLIDSEKVFSYMMRTFEARKPATVKYCCLLLNSQNKKINEDIDYVGFKINQANIVGYGIDTPEKLARLPYIGYFEDAH